MFYYRCKAVPVEYGNLKDIEKYDRPLHSFEELAERFRLLQTAYEYAAKEHADIIVNPYPEISGVAELGVCHTVKRKLFSGTVKKNCFSLWADKFSEDGILTLYDCETTEISEVKRIFAELIQGGKLPDFGKWKSTVIG